MKRTDLLTIKTAVYHYAGVNSTQELKDKFQLPSDLDLRKRANWIKVLFHFYAKEVNLKAIAAEYTAKNQLESSFAVLEGWKQNYLNNPEELTTAVWRAMVGVQFEAA